MSQMSIIAKGVSYRSVTGVGALLLKWSVILLCFDGVDDSFSCDGSDCCMVFWSRKYQ